nr:hypothetical protein [Sicyoidochytrium minutum DNA virus]
MAATIVPQDAILRDGVSSTTFTISGGGCIRPGLPNDVHYMGFITPGSGTTIITDTAQPWPVSKLLVMARKVAEKFDLNLYTQWQDACNAGTTRYCDYIQDMKNNYMPVFGMTNGDLFSQQKIGITCLPYASYFEGDTRQEVYAFVFTFNPNTQINFNIPEQPMTLTYMRANFLNFSGPASYTIPDGTLVYTLVFDLTRDDEWNLCGIRQDQTQCVTNAFTLQRPSLCSIAASNEAYAAQCVAWHNEQEEGTYNAFSTNMCVETAAGNLEECACLARETFTLYQLATEDPNLQTVKAACWWQPCKLNSQTLWRTTEEIDAVCPNDICLNIQKIENVTDSQITGLQQYVGCITNNEADGGGGSGGGSNTDNRTPEQKAEDTRNLILYILGGAGGVLLIVAIVLIVRRVNAGKVALKKKQQGKVLTPKEQQLAYKEELKIYNKQLAEAQKSRPQTNRPTKAAQGATKATPEPNKTAPETKKT